MSMTKTKRSLLTAGAAVTLAAAVLMGGGTFAYLSDNTNDTPVINEFDPNTVYVALSETTGNTYEILPGTSAAKDPTVTVTTTVDAFVFVEVTDNTDGLVTYEIADSWQPLNGYDNIYYQIVTVRADSDEATVATLAVLKNNTVSYSAALTNSDMLVKNEDGTYSLKDGLKLTFTASAIQAQPWYNGTEAEDVGAAAVNAYRGESTVFATVSGDIKTALTSGNDVILQENIDYNNKASSSNAQYLNVYSSQAKPAVATLDLNGKTILGKTSASYVILVDGYQTLTIEGNGTVTGDASTLAASKNASTVAVGQYATAIINDGTYTASVNQDGYGNRVVYVVGMHATAIINGGFFQASAPAADGKYYVLSLGTANLETATIVCYGGTFVNQNPAQGTEMGNDPTVTTGGFVAEGYHVESATQENGDIWYTVVPDEA